MSQQRLKTGVIVSNLGTPDAPTAPAVRRYLKEFLSDQRVVEIPKLAWWPILNLIILNVRPKKSARAYASVWTENGSPLLYFSQQLTNAIAAELDQENISVRLAMRYGNPSIASVMEDFKEQGVERVVVLPLYPQYSATTTAATYDEVNRIMMSWRDVPSLDFIRDYHRNEQYIQVMAQYIESYWREHGRGKFLLFSFHGIPERNVKLGDPYQQQSTKTAELLAQALGLTDEEWQLTFQSRFGYQTWLQPYTDATLKELPATGCQSVDVFCPGFPVDCLETLEEIAEENKEYFMAAGGETFRYIPALNDSPEHAQMLVNLLESHI